MTAIQAQDRAPNFTAIAHSGEQISLAGFQGHKAVVLFFYPMDGTSICTAEACAFRDAYEDFVKAGAVVIGVSGDSLESHRSFAQKQQLPFLLVSDRDGAIRRAFGVPKTWGVFPGRVTYIIDKRGIVQHVFNAQFTASQHVTEAMGIVNKLANDEGGS